MAKKTSAPRRSTRRARTLVELMMKEMHASLRDPDRLSPEMWDKLFGAKQSMIANLHKLVVTLMALSEDEVPQKQAQEDSAAEALTAEEMLMLTAWLAERGDEGD